MIDKNFLQQVSEISKQKNQIDTSLYQKFNVKRGLRNSDGTGVLVGLTAIGEVHGYVIVDEEKMPDHGRLMYRGIDVYDLVNGCRAENRHGFEETCYLLLFGELPDKVALDEFKSQLAELRNLPEGFIEDMIMKAPSKDIMNKLARSVLASYSYDENPDELSISNLIEQSLELLARMPMIAAYAYQTKAHYFDNKSLFIHSPNPNFDHAENFLHVMRADNEFSKLEAEILDLSLILHAEHGGGNNSAFATHVVSSSGTDIYSAISAAIGSLKGPKHGGANAKVMGMMDNIKSNVKKWNDRGEVADYLAKIIRKEANDGSGLIYGMGHAVYTLSDPRAILLKHKAQELAKEKNMEEEYNLYSLIEELAPQIFLEVKKDKKVISANVDLYSGFVYSMLNIPPELYTPIFAISRIIGWCAHMIEEVIFSKRIIRPAYKSVSKKQVYTPLSER